MYQKCEVRQVKRVIPCYRDFELCSDPDCERCHGTGESEREMTLVIPQYLPTPAFDAYLAARLVGQDV